MESVVVYCGRFFFAVLLEEERLTEGDAGLPRLAVAEVDVFSEYKGFQFPATPARLES